MYPRIDHVWIFLTDRCNVNCPHCFFAHKSGQKQLSTRSTDALFRFLSPLASGQFIISGGEPLMAWPALRLLIARVRARFPEAYLSVQSNGLMIKRGQLAFLKANRANLELGIDGDAWTVAASRRGLPEKGFERLCAALSLAQKLRMSLSTTMTVTPGNVRSLAQNFDFLLGLKARCIEIHPAFMAKWSAEGVRLFLRGYRYATASGLRTGETNLVSREYSRAARGLWDMVILPDGKIFPNWTFLSFPEHVRERFAVMELSAAGARFLPAARSYFSRLADFLRRAPGRVSYRQLSNFNASLAVAEWGNPAAARRFEEYVFLCQEIERIDLQAIKRRADHDPL